MSDNPSHQCVVCGWSVLCVFLHCCQHCSYLSKQLFLIVFGSYIALRLGELRMSVLSVRLDLTLSAHVMSDGSGSPCRMMSERPKKEIQHFHCPHCCEHVCWTFWFHDCGHAVSECSHIHAEHFQSTCARNIFQHEIVTLYHWEFAVFNDAFCSFVWFRMCFAFDA